MYFEDGLQKEVDLVAGWLPVTRRKKMSQPASGRRMWGNYRLVSLTLAFRNNMGQILLKAMSTLFIRQEIVWEQLGQISQNQILSDPSDCLM